MSQYIPLIVAVVIIILVLMVLSSAIKIVRPTQRGLVERFGKYNRFAPPGMHFMIPVAEKMYLVNITEQMVDAQPQEIITNDNLNATVDAQVYFKVKDTEEDIKACQYNVRNYEYQIVNLARTTLRNIIGTLTLRSANSERGRINTALYQTLFTETQRWGIEIVRTELKEINPPQDVQATMNKVVKAENEKIAAIDTATAAETEADGRRRAVIKLAEADKQSTILRAEGEAEAIKLVNEAANQYFKGNAQLLRKLEAVEKSLSANAKIVVPSDSSLVNVIGNLMGGEEKK
jgi:regulator of protease activity HflC (stomatin/prohibitin superfamily)